VSAAAARLQLTARRAADELNAFAGWWLHELRDTWLMVSERVAPQRAQHFIVDLCGPGGVIRRAGQGASDAIVEFSFDSAGELPDLSQLWPNSVPRDARATVLLPDSCVLACELRLPPVADRDLTRAVDLQLERELPLARHELYVDWSVREVRADRSRVVDVIVARRTVVDDIRNAVRAWGWRLVAVTRHESGRQRFNLLPVKGGRWSFHVGRRERYLAWSASALVFLYASVALARGAIERASFRDELEQARAQIARIDEQNALLAREGRPIVLLHEIMAQPSAAEGVIAISHAMPKDSWIYQADIRSSAAGVSMQLEAYTPSSTNLLQGLEASGRLAAVELVQTTAAGPGSAAERVEFRAAIGTGVEP
jgi:hypothetical protein